MQLAVSEVSGRGSPVPVRASLIRSKSFDTVREEVAARAALSFSDQVLPLSRLHMQEDESGLVEVPGVGSLALTDWSRSQLSRMLGIRWQRWFNETLVSPEERAGEINRRLGRSGVEWKLRSRRYGEGEQGQGAGDGVLRAFVSRTYTPIDDERVFERLALFMDLRAQTFRFVRVDRTDKTSQYVAVTEDDVDLGNGTPDLHRHGFLLVNSEVGAAALHLMEYLFRLVCTNGLVIVTAAKRLFYRIHRTTTDESLDRDLAYAFVQLPERWSQGTRLLREARHESITEPENVIRALLDADTEVRPYTERVVDDYRAEPEPTRFGIVQAMTRTAQRLPPEDRLFMERFAGGVLAGQFEVAA